MLAVCLSRFFHWLLIDHVIIKQKRTGTEPCFCDLGSTTLTTRHVNMLPGYPHSASLSSEGHVSSSPANSDVPVPLSAAISMTSAPNGINGYSGGLPPAITLHNMAVPSSPGFLNGATCKL